MYAAAQGTEQALAESLTGVPSHDDAILAMLVGDITNGTALNERNLAAVSFVVWWGKRGGICVFVCG